MIISAFLLHQQKDCWMEEKKLSLASYEFIRHDYRQTAELMTELYVIKNFTEKLFNIETNVKKKKSGKGKTRTY